MIELMTVISVIAILAAIALPAYQDYIVRTRIAEAFVLAGAQKTGVIANAAVGSSDLAANAATVSGTANVTSLAVSSANGAITVVTTARAGSGSITLTPRDGQGVPLQAGTVPVGIIEWACSTTLPSKHAPRSCAGS